MIRTLESMQVDGARGLVGPPSASVDALSFYDVPSASLPSTQSSFTVGLEFVVEFEERLVVIDLAETLESAQEH